MKQHRLREVDTDNLTATCVVCGPVRVYKRRDRERVRYRCSVYLRQADRKKTFRDGNPLDLELRDRLEVEQGGKCGLCGDDARLVFDHCHESGKPRALLCDPCNKGLGFFRDDAKRLRAAIDYLGRYA